MRAEVGAKDAVHGEEMAAEDKKRSTIEWGLVVVHAAVDERQRAALERQGSALVDTSEQRPVAGGTTRLCWYGIHARASPMVLASGLGLG